MKFYAVAALLALSTQAITLQEAANTDTGSAEVVMREMTIVGFFFDGLDFGMIWSDLTDEQKDQIKISLFSQTLQFNGFDAANFTDGVFKFTDEQRKAEITKR